MAVAAHENACWFSRQARSRGESLPLLSPAVRTPTLPSSLGKEQVSGGWEELSPSRGGATRLRLSRLNLFITTTDPPHPLPPPASAVCTPRPQFGSFNVCLHVRHKVRNHQSPKSPGSELANPPPRCWRVLHATSSRSQKAEVAGLLTLNRGF